MTTVLIGGGWENPAATYGPFLAAAGADPQIACVVLDEGDGTMQFDRWRELLTDITACRPRPVLVPVGGRLDPTSFEDADGLLVCGGLTPAYAAALAPAAGPIRKWLGMNRAYAGFSAGAAIAARRALVGGFALDGRQVCPDAAAEDLEEVTVVDGLGLVPFAVEVHAAQWGTLGRLTAAIEAGLVVSGVALDNDTALVLDNGTARLVGTGAAHLARRNDAGVVVKSIAAAGGSDVERELSRWMRV